MGSGRSRFRKGWGRGGLRSRRVESGRGGVKTGGVRNGWGHRGVRSKRVESGRGGDRKGQGSAFE